MAVSVLEPISPAIERTRLVLFAPFDLNKWLGLGFCAFLAALGSGGGGGGGNTGGGGGGDGEMDFEPAVEWVRDNVVIVAAVVAGVLLFGLLLGMLLTWLSSRGKFMLLDGVVCNRGAVVEPWHEYRREGNSLFKFRFCFGLFVLAMFVLLLAVCGLVAWPGIAQNQFGPSAILAAVGFVVGIIPIAIVSGVVELFLNDFVAPVMYLRRIRVNEAWGVFYREMLQGRAGTFVLYVLVKMVIAVVVGAAGIAIVCMTCCCAALPYVGSVFMLPLTVFVRCYSLYFIEQFGSNWRVFPQPGLEPLPAVPPSP
jgi:hypothetical protein